MRHCDCGYTPNHRICRHSQVSGPPHRTPLLLLSELSFLRHVPLLCSFADHYPNKSRLSALCSHRSTQGISLAGKDMNPQFRCSLSRALHLSHCRQAAQIYHDLYLHHCRTVLHPPDEAGPFLREGMTASFFPERQDLWVWSGSHQSLLKYTSALPLI